MNYAFIAIMAVVIMTCVGIVFGFVLALADKKFAMEENPLIGEVKEALPQGQCGACGFAGCAKYAEAVVLDPDVPPNLCVPGKAEVAAVVAKLQNLSMLTSNAVAVMGLPKWPLNTRAFMTVLLPNWYSRVRKRVSLAVSVLATASVPARSML